MSMRVMLVDIYRLDYLFKSKLVVTPLSNTHTFILNHCYFYGNIQFDDI